MIKGEVLYNMDTAAFTKNIEKDNDSATMATAYNKEASVTYKRWKPESRDKKD